MKLPGWSFVLVGLIVGGVSATMYFSGKTQMGLFLLVGVAMTVFGLIRAYIDSTSSEARTNERAALEKELPSNNPRTYSLSTIPRVCGTCGTKNNPRASFCGHCGHRL